jgi:hypothetical protein
MSFFLLAARSPGRRCALSSRSGRSSDHPRSCGSTGSPPEFAGRPPEAFLGRSPEQPDIQKTLANLFGGEGRNSEWADLTFLRSVSGPLEPVPADPRAGARPSREGHGRINIVTDDGRKTIDVDAGRSCRRAGSTISSSFLGLTNGPDDDLAQVLGRGVKAGMAATARSTSRRRRSARASRICSARTDTSSSIRTPSRRASKSSFR